MTKEELEKIENSMTKEQIIERARTLRPVAEFKNIGSMMFWVDGGRIHMTSYTWNLKRLKPTGYLRELGRVKTYHNGSLFSSSRRSMSVFISVLIQRLRPSWLCQAAVNMTIILNAGMPRRFTTLATCQTISGTEK